MEEHTEKTSPQSVKQNLKDYVKENRVNLSVVNRGWYIFLNLYFWITFFTIIVLIILGIIFLYPYISLFVQNQDKIISYLQDLM